MPPIRSETELVLLRHGKSSWNLENRFTGWTDIDLSAQGYWEAQHAGRLLKEAGYTFDVAFTSVLKRATRTLQIVLGELDKMWIPVYHSWRLNERHYGALQGLNKKETAVQYSDEQVHQWRRGYAIRPPALAWEDSRHPRFNPQYAHVAMADLPSTESLQDTLARVLPYWREMIVPSLKQGQKVLIVAHGNSLRALVKHLDCLSDEEIVKLNIPTGLPLVYELNDSLKAVRRYYLGDEETVTAVTAAAANQMTAME